MAADNKKPTIENRLEQIENNIWQIRRERAVEAFLGEYSDGFAVNIYFKEKDIAVSPIIIAAKIVNKTKDGFDFVVVDELPPIGMLVPEFRIEILEDKMGDKFPLVYVRGKAGGEDLVCVYELSLKSKRAFCLFKQDLNALGHIFEKAKDITGSARLRGLAEKIDLCFGKVRERSYRTARKWRFDDDSCVLYWDERDKV